MYSRNVTCTVDPAKVMGFWTTMSEKLLPRIQSQLGFVANIESFDRNTGQFNCLTLWNTKADVGSYDKGLFQEVAASLTPLIKGEPTVLTLPVENSSLHNLKAGKATA